MTNINTFLPALRETIAGCAMSNDPSTQNAASICNDSGEILHGPFVNSFPDGVKETPERWETRPDKYYYVEHSERKAILFCAKYGVALDGLTLVCPFFACADCARAIVESGIKRVVGIERPLNCTHDRWNDSCNAGDIILKEGGVEVLTTDMNFGITVLRNGSPSLI